MAMWQSSEKTSVPAGCEYYAGRLTYQCSMFSWSTTFFLLLFILVWTCACSLMVYSYLTQGEPEIWFCGLFCLGDVVVLMVLLYEIFGNETGYLDKTGFHRTVYFFFLTWKKDIPLEKIRKFRMGKDPSFKQNNRPAICVDIITDDAPYKFIRRFSDCDVQYWIVENGNDFLAKQSGAVSADARSCPSNDSALSVQDMFSIESEGGGLDDSDKDDQGEYEDTDEPIIENYILSDYISSVRPPDETDWVNTKEFDSVSFEKKCKFSGAFFSLLFFMVFWNSVVSVFICAMWGIVPMGETSGGATPGAYDQSQISKEKANEATVPVTAQVEKKYIPLRERTIRINGKDEPIFGMTWWFLFCFLIPFEIIGLVLIFRCVMILLAPFTRLIWVFKHHNAICTKQILGVPFSREYSLDSLYLMENNQTQAVGRTQGSLVFRDRNSVELCRISELSSQEARWMAGEIRRVVR